MISLFFNILQLPRTTVAIDLASGVGCTSVIIFLADEF